MYRSHVVLITWVAAVRDGRDVIDSPIGAVSNRPAAYPAGGVIRGPVFEARLVGFVVSVHPDSLIQIALNGRPCVSGIYCYTVANWKLSVPDVTSR